MIIPGLALFYGGMVRDKNVLSTMMYSFISVCVVSVVWVLWGYTIAFGTDVGGVVGSFEFLWSSGVGPEAFPGTAVPHLAFMVFQLMFAGITVALISGAVAERMKFSAFVLFASPVGHPDLCTVGPLGLGRRMVGPIRRPGFCGWHCRSHQFGCGCLGRSVGPGETARLRVRKDGSP